MPSPYTAGETRRVLRGHSHPENNFPLCFAHFLHLVSNQNVFGVFALSHRLKFAIPRKRFLSEIL